MAGPAIRTWEFAKALSTNHRVVLISPNKTDLKAAEFDLVSFNDPSCKRHFQDAEILITQRLTVPLAFLTTAHGIKVIIDAYDPSPLELLEYYKNESEGERQKKISSEISSLAFSFKMAHGILCASEKQRDLWIGFLMGQKIISPLLYDRDPSLKDFIGVVPFGISSNKPKKNGAGLKEKLGLHPDDKVILWGGGIWNWFDPLTLIKAMKIISKERTDIKLVFMGVKPPDPLAPNMSMAQEAMQLARELDLRDRVVFFHQDWVPYNERENFLLDADIGVSTHFDHLETRFSFRTRMLDYVWAELPIVSTEGDAFAELIATHQVGAAVPFQNEQAVAAALLALLENPQQIQQIKSNLSAVGKVFRWESIVAPLHRMIGQLTLESKVRSNWKDGKALFALLTAKIREKGLAACCKKAFHQYVYPKS